LLLQVSPQVGVHGSLICRLRRPCHRPSKSNPHCCVCRFRSLPDIFPPVRWTSVVLKLKHRPQRGTTSSIHGRTVQRNT
jgi:hypothetical protein